MLLLIHIEFLSLLRLMEKVLHSKGTSTQLIRTKSNRVIKFFQGNLGNLKMILEIRRRFKIRALVSSGILAFMLNCGSNT